MFGIQITPRVSQASVRPAVRSAHGRKKAALLGAADKKRPSRNAGDSNGY